jgi:protein-ribulosamine 3-kinase
MQIPEKLAAALGGTWQLQPLRASGFCDTWCATDTKRKLFVKSATDAAGAAMLEAEADGLQALAATRTVRVPRVETMEPGVLAMEWLDFAVPDAGFGARFGCALAELHAVPQADYGWPRDNFLGATPQVNTPHEDWLVFFARHRLDAMRLRIADPRIDEAVHQVMTTLPQLFADGYRPRPSLIHGDLWSGNWGMLADGTPVIYDPAVSCSDAEAELAMMELFGSPPSDFWPAYRESAGLHPGYENRRPLYQLYHLLNHAALFGGGYLEQSLRCAREL